MPKPTIITGIKRTAIAIQTQDDVLGLSYATPELLNDTQELGYKPKQNVEALYAENQIREQGIAFQQTDIDLALASFTSAQRAKVLGQTIAANGGVFASATDQPPYVALLYKATISGGFRYGVFFKGMFQVPDETIKGQEGKIAYAVPKLSASFIPNTFNGMWEYHVDTTDPNCPNDIDITWFQSVTIPNADTTIPTISSTVPANNATTVSRTANFVWTFSEGLNPATVNTNNFYLISDSDGSIVPATLLYNDTAKTVTLTPVGQLSATTKYLAIADSDITDLAGNHLVQVNKIFTTAS